MKIIKQHYFFNLWKDNLHSELFYSILFNGLAQLAFEELYTQV